MARLIRGEQSNSGLKLSADRKVSPRGWWQAGGVRHGRWVANLPNSFGLPTRVTCPGLTPFCDACYATNSERSKGVAGLLHHNLALLTAAGTVTAMAELLSEMIGRLSTEFRALRLPPEQWLCRVHWSGDFFSTDYAEAWAWVMRANRKVSFWAYTRSFTAPVDVVPILADVPNLALYLSADRHNIDAAREQVKKYPAVHLALCDTDYVRARALAPEGRLLAIPCPENAGRMPLMDADSVGNGVGACVTCRLCPDARRDILFSTTHVEDVAVYLRERTRPIPGEAKYCANPDCGRELGPHKSKWCEPRCRWVTYRRKQKALADG